MDRRNCRWWNKNILINHIEMPLVLNKQAALPNRHYYCSTKKNNVSFSKKFSDYWMCRGNKKNQNLSAKFQRQNFAQKKSKRILFFLIYQNWRKTSLSRQSILLVILSSSISSGSHKILCNSFRLYTGLSTPVMCKRAVNSVYEEIAEHFGVRM